MTSTDELSILGKNGYAKDILRVCSEANQGMRKYMEDELTFTLERWNRKRAAFLAIFDGHGGKEAAKFARKHLFDNIKAQSEFYSDDPEAVKKAISDGFMKTHLEMNADIGNWPKRKDGHNSTSGTTATVAIVRNNKLYIAHVGDSAAVLAKKVDNKMVVEELTIDHKPDNADEKSRIQALGGKVAVSNGGIPRVVWKREVRNASPQIGRATPKHEYVPFLAVSRALGDLWSYDKDRDHYIVSPVPDVQCIDIIPGVHKYLILASDGLWGVMNAKEAVDAVYTFETTSKCDVLKRNVSDTLIKTSLMLWQKKKSRADNISAIVVFFDDEYKELSSEKSVELEDEHSCSDTDLCSDNEDTPPMDQSIKNFPTLKRQLNLFQKNIQDEVTKKPKQKGENTRLLTEITQNKRKSVDGGTPNNTSKKKIKTSCSDPLLNSEESHQCKVITTLSKESLKELQLDQDVDFADDESDNINESATLSVNEPSNIHNEITIHSTFNKIIPVGGEGSGN